MHYSVAQGHMSDEKPEPTVRITHLERILKLGFEFGYVHKLLAEAYYELGESAQARKYLKRAYEIDPELSGAVRISRALGMLPRKDPVSSPKRRARHRYTRTDQIPSPSQIREWAASQRWEEILAYADVSDYSPRIVPKSRNRLRQIAISLGGCHTGQARERLTQFLDSVYWDVRKASISSLARIGDMQTLDLLEAFVPRNSSDEVAMREAIPYLRSRLASRSPTSTKAPTDMLLKRAERALAARSYGRARFLLENAVSGMNETDLGYVDAITLLARTCAEMGDSREAVELMKPVLHRLPVPSEGEVSRELASWLWGCLVFEDYDPAHDEDYLLALDIHLTLALTSDDPHEVLSNLRRLTRWLEILGDGSTAEWIRGMIRTSAPGTWHVDKTSREQYVRGIKLSKDLTVRLDELRARMQSGIPHKLSQVMHDPDALAASDRLLGYGRARGGGRR